MGLFDELKGLAAQYTGGGVPAGDPGEHFDQLSQAVDKPTLATGYRGGHALGPDTAFPPIGFPVVL